MPWNDDGLGPVPRRSEDELLALTEAKAKSQAGLARRQLGTGILAAVMLVAGTATALARLDRDAGTKVQSASGGDAGIDAPTTSLPPPISLPPNLPPMTFVGPTTTTEPPAPPRPTTTIPTSTSTVPAPTTTTSSIPPYCVPAELAGRATTDQATYLRGQVVRVTVEVRNLLARECFLTASRQYGLVVTDGSGTVVTGATTHADCLTDCGEVLAAGATHQVTSCWLQTRNGELVPAGTYILDATFYGTAYPATIQISGPPPAVPPTTIYLRGDTSCS